MDTIFALATARGKAGVAIIRVSGPHALVAGANLAGPLPLLRRAGLRNLKNTAGDVLDQALVLHFSAGHSFTGEELVEFQLHGSVATVKAVLAALGGMDGLRMAEPGEFTRQALENERLDLTQVEGLADLIDAETESQRRQALRVLSGELGDKAEVWRSKLIRAAALLEATIDFVDEDVPVDVRPEVEELLVNVRNELQIEADGTIVAERIRDGFEVAIVGPPNVGKSTLLNALAGREAAITSEIAGTTRDVIEVRMDLHGLPVTFLDTAGLRKAEDTIEAIGVQRAIERAQKADLRVFLRDDSSIYSDLAPTKHDIVLFGKADTRQTNEPGVSGITGQGLSELIQRITSTLENRTATAATATRERHRIAIERAISSLDLSKTEIEHGPDRTELAAEELRRAISALDSLVGLVDVEHILDEIFASFCVGK
ncbi:MAG: tRNA uridine-5-carboxymethylaminomethyl(34) synthesis GTPase MnmE [Marinosulfonomonas sp.]|nr:MAG: tRNA uridine-5-carboxymethylaminomethyl(34) synthesis GTPase MnmE [Marinosulfonomonas sp.]